MEVKPVNTLEQRGNAILKRIPKKTAKGVEVGVLMGSLSRYLLSSHEGLKLFMVDSWAPEWLQPEAYKATRDIHAVHDMATVNRHRNAALNVEKRFFPRAKVLDMPSVKAAALIDDASMDFVFLDADHSYEGVMADLAAWVPKVKPGGWICGHDYLNDQPEFAFGVTRAVDEWADGRTVKTDKNYTWFVKL